MTLGIVTVCIKMQSEMTPRKKHLGTKAFIIMTLSINMLSTMTISIMILSIMTLGIMTLRIKMLSMTLSRNILAPGHSA
jgi:hypothetical protein